MKNVITNTKKGFLMVTMFVTLLSFANDASSFIIKNDAKRTSLTLENVKKGNLLSIKDNNGIVLYKEQIQHTGIYTKGFDLTELPDGSYIFELDGDTEIKTIPFKVKYNRVLLNKDLEVTVFKPVIRVKDNLLFISKFDLNNEPLKIDIYFESLNDIYSSGLIYSKIIKNEIKKEKVFKLGDLNNGSYKVVLTSENRKFTEYINK